MARRLRPPSHSMDRRSFLRIGGYAVVGLAACGGKDDGDSGSGSGDCADSDGGSGDGGSGDGGSGDGGTGDGGTGDGGTGDGGSTDGGTTDGCGGGTDCDLTDDNIEGPFYREDAPSRDDLDLYEDDGTPLTLTGRVLDTDCTPIAAAEVDLWHADPGGAYDNDTDEMRYRGRVTTDAEGRFAVTTMVPGWYLNGSAYRPAHIHVKVRVGGAERLTTQLYFAGDPYLAADPFVEGAPVMAVDDSGEGWSCAVDIVV